MTEPARDYHNDVIVRLRRLRGLKNIQVHKLGDMIMRVGNLPGNIETVPMFSVVARSYTIENKQNVLLSAGIHGDEPAGVWALLKFLEDLAPRYLSKFNFFVYPCINPAGYVYSTRGNWRGDDVNRAFRMMAHTQEARAVIGELTHGPSRYSLTIDHHECNPEFEDDEFRRNGFTKKDNPDGFWLWEHQDDPSKRIGKKIIDAMSGAGIPVCKWPKIFGDTSDGNGVVAYPEGCTSALYSHAKSFDVFLHKHYTHHAFTVETISTWDKDRRVQAHLLAITTALDEYAGR